MRSDRKSQIRDRLIHGWWEAHALLFAFMFLGWLVGAALVLAGAMDTVPGGLRGLVFGVGGLAVGMTIGLYVIDRMMRWPSR